MKNRLLPLFMIIVVFFAQVITVEVFAETSSDSTGITMLRPIDATYVSQHGEDVNTNFYGSSTMKVNYTKNAGGSEAYGQYGYMKFDISDIDRDLIVSAKLRVHVEDTGDKRFSTRTVGIFETCESDWDGSIITWENGKSESGTLLGSFTVSANGYNIIDTGWREIDVTEYLQNGIGSCVSLMAKMTSDVAHNVIITSGTYSGKPDDFDETVHGKNMPELVIECYDMVILLH